MDVRALNADEWQLKRDLRLTALNDSPSAFVSNYAREQHRPEAEWRDWPRGGNFYVAFEDGAPVGIAASWIAAADPDTTHLISMWVVPEVRGRRIAARLVDAVVRWAREQGTEAVELEVAAGNDAALAAYLRAGFMIADGVPFTAGGTVLRQRLR